MQLVDQTLYLIQLYPILLALLWPIAALLSFIIFRDEKVPYQTRYDDFGDAARSYAARMYEEQANKRKRFRHFSAIGIIASILYLWLR